MSFKSSGPKTRPERVKPPPRPPSPPSPTSAHHKPTRRLSDASDASSQTSAVFHDARFAPEEEQSMIQTSNATKASANQQFANSDYESAIGTYDRAVSELPSYLDYELAVLQSNIAACHVKLSQWKDAVAACEKGLEGLEREMPTAEGQKAAKKKSVHKSKRRKDPATKRKGIESDSESEDEKTPHQAPSQESANDQVIELPSSASESELTRTLHELNLSDARKADITRIRTKLLLRRARARSSLDPPTWSALGGALEDYRLLSSTPAYFSSLPTSDQKTVRVALITLPGKVEEAKQREVGEMMGKLKELGNGILKPFGLSTDMFKMTQGADGGWSMSIDGNAGGGKKE